MTRISNRVYRTRVKKCGISVSEGGTQNCSLFRKAVYCLRFAFTGITPPRISDIFNSMYQGHWDTNRFHPIVLYNKQSLGSFFKHLVRIFLLPVPHGANHPNYDAILNSDISRFPRTAVRAGIQVSIDRLPGRYTTCINDVFTDTDIL